MLLDGFPMPLINVAYLAHQRKRWMRPEAHLFVRPDWRNFVPPKLQADHPFALYENKYRPDQARVPAGSREGGQWTDEEGGGADEGEIPPNARPAQYRTDENGGRSTANNKRYGHHYVPRAVVTHSGVSDEARKVFEAAKTGKLYDVRSNQWDFAHRECNVAARDAMNDYLAKNNIRPQDMTAAQAREFLGKVFESTDPRIKNYNLGVLMRELAQRLYRRGGRE